MADIKKSDKDKDINYLSMSSSVKKYSRDAIKDVFLDIRSSYFQDADSAFDTAKKAYLEDSTKPRPEDVYQKKKLELAFDIDHIADIVVKHSGTHLLKFRTAEFNKANADENIETSVLRLSRIGSSKAERFHPSMDARKSKLAKIIFRPIEIEGHNRVTNLIDHIQDPDDLSAEIIASFVSAFGQDILDSILRELRRGNVYTTGLSISHFPVIFLPSEVGDIQVTPIASAQSHGNMSNLRWKLLQDVRDRMSEVKRSDDQMDVLKKEQWSIGNDFCSQTLTSQMQNILPGANSSRFRLLAKFPGVMSSDDAQIYRFSMGGRQPSIEDKDLAERMKSFIKLFTVWTKHHSPEISASLDRIAKSCARIAKEHAEDILECAKKNNPDFGGNVDLSILCLSAYRSEYKLSGDEIAMAKKIMSQKKFKSHMEM